MNSTSQTSDCYRKTNFSLKGAVYNQSICTCVWRYGRYSWLQHRDKGSCSFGTNGRVKTNTQENNQNWWKISGKNKNLIGDHVNVWIIFWNFYFFLEIFFEKYIWMSGYTFQYGKWISGYTFQYGNWPEKTLDGSVSVEGLAQTLLKDWAATRSTWLTVDLKYKKLEKNNLDFF